MVRLLPSRVVRRTVEPVRASAKVIFLVTTRSLPSLVNVLCGFSSTVKMRSAGMTFGCSLPLSGKVIFVPFFQPGALRGAKFIGRPPLPKELKISSPNIPPKALEPPLMPLPPNGLEKPKNSAKMSSAFLGLNLKFVGPSPVEKKVAPPGPPAFGGGTWPLSPSSPY
ncbi:hypothetical protein GH714_002671 [Hevea brasiliensis]|uniref:Uncharacterized protein n=1 Tax=Hevea brasiliensis TaxID=3981 RepID=A0A6A6LZN2_HEVBR|nr:hypothetical protein GH714_002671 [Hevea brasiliensis]